MNNLKRDEFKSRLFVILCVLINIFLFLSINFAYNSNKYIKARSSPTPTGTTTSSSGVDDICIYSNTIPDNYEFYYSSNIMVCNSSKVPIRATAADEGQIIGFLNNGDLVVIEGVDFNNSCGWTQISYNNRLGYIKTCYLSYSMNFSNINQLMYITENTNVYSNPFPADANIVGEAYYNNTIIAVGQNDVWVQINIDGTLYYILKNKTSVTMPFISSDAYVLVYGNTNVYKEADENSTIVCVLNENDIVHQVAYNDKWVKIQANGENYYISRNLIQ